MYGKKRKSGRMGTAIAQTTVMSRAFTLIELLIVVAIIAILAAIAVPNFLEAQTRAKVSRVKNDLRALATAVEAYRTDNSGYPEYAVVRYPQVDIEDPAVTTGQDYFEYLSRRPGLTVTTPIAYITTIPPDPFASRYPEPQPVIMDYSYKNSRQNDRIFTGDRSSEPWLGPGGEVLLRDWGEWRLNSVGPVGANVAPQRRQDDIKFNIIYDPSNGTVSRGAIVRSQRKSESLRK